MMSSPMDDAERSLFAKELNRGIEGSGKSIATIVDEFLAAGYAVPERALNNWIKGYFLPRSEASGEVISVLERILGVDTSLLVHALATDLASGRSFVPGEGAGSLAPVIADVIDGDLDRQFANSDADTDWSCELIRVAIEDYLTLGPGYSEVGQRIVTWARVPAAPNPTINFPIVYEKTDIPEYDRIVYDIEGAKLAGQRVYQQGNGQVNVTSRLVLPADLEPGDICRVALTCGCTRTKEMDRATERFFPWDLEWYSCQATFEGEVPEHIEYVFEEALGDGEMADRVVFPLEPVDGVVKYRREPQPKGIGWVQWS